MIGDLRVGKREAKAAQSRLMEAYQTIASARVNPLAWLAVAHRAHHPGSDVGRVAALLAAFAPRFSDIYLRDICQPTILSRADAHEALKVLERASLLKIAPSLRSEALELTLALPGMPVAADLGREERLRA